ncbi:class I SAM-dependent methyltransferase [Actinacidiphila oryziradicis]|jgi:hypothetical protein|uniref:class I SAM-dependent methyltransferase n=1 Tax=Actinacidiphila oryziradicis TaxID=2571141 RepID=UPI0023F09335|nr:class I SAM-dependent methyltransferase [Actinacidiphila oryziradicis]MCW2873625.1 class SAM-dependent methyltransferase [Actinacidiphila oryziradicis]
MTVTRTNSDTATDTNTNTGTDDTQRLPQSFYDVPGWFFNTDVVLFDWFLARQEREKQDGDLLEMGAYMGKSAIFMSGHLRSGETFTVCDLFDSEAPDGRNDAEVRGSYSTLTRRSFEANYLSFRQQLPRVIQAPTSVVPGMVEDDSCRFVHVDASHLYEHVRGDIAAARGALRGDGVVVLDDFRSEHTPGVACATWEAVVGEGLRPICVSPNKFYGTWGDPAPMQQELLAELRERGDFWTSPQDVAGHSLVIVNGPKAKPPRLPASRHAPQETEGTKEAATVRAAAPRQAPEPARTLQRPRRSALRRLAVDLLPPIVTRAVVRGLRVLRRARSKA